MYVQMGGCGMFGLRIYKINYKLVLYICMLSTIISYRVDQSNIGNLPHASHSVQLGISLTRPG